MGVFLKSPVAFVNASNNSGFMFWKTFWAKVRLFGLSVIELFRPRKFDDDVESENPLFTPIVLGTIADDMGVGTGGVIGTTGGGGVCSTGGGFCIRRSVEDRLACMLCRFCLACCNLSSCGVIGKDVDAMDGGITNVLPPKFNSGIGVVSIRALVFLSEVIFLDLLPVFEIVDCSPKGCVLSVGD